MNGMMLAVLAAILLPVTASAHLPVAGLGDFYNGLLHPFFSLPHLLALVVLGILIGRRLDAWGTAVLPVFPAALALGLISAGYGIGFPAENLLLAGAALIGLLVVTDWPPPRWAAFTLAAASGLAMGFDFFNEQVRSPAALNIGTGITLYLSFLYVLMLAEKFHSRRWQLTGLRVLGSWIAACALLALSLRLFIPKP